MIICIDPREVRSSWALGILTSESVSSRRCDSDLIASGCMKPGGVSGNCLHASANILKLMAPTGSEASSGQLGYVGSCPLLLGLWFISQYHSLLHRGFMKPQAPPLQPPVWRHPTGHPSQAELWGICGGPGLCCRVCWGDLMVWHTAGGPSAVPSSGLSLLPRYPWFPGFWEVMKGENLFISTQSG